MWVMIFQYHRHCLRTRYFFLYLLPAPGVVPGQQTAIFVLVLSTFRVPICRTGGLHQAREE